MNEKVDFSCLIGKNQEQLEIVERKKIDHEFVAYLRMDIGNTSTVAQDAAYCMRNILRRWPMEFPNANRLRQLAMYVLDSEFSKSYQRKCLIAIERYATFMGIEGVKLKKPRLNQPDIKYLTIEEMGKLIKAAKCQRDLTILVLLCKTGIRASELVNLNVDDIDFQRREISIRHGKRDKARKVDFDDQTDRVLRTYIGSNGKNPNSPLFLSMRHRRMSYKALHQMVKLTGERIKIKVHPHMLRHSFATAWVANESDIFHLQGLLGHTDITMTRRYFHACAERIVSL